MVRARHQELCETRSEPRPPYGPEPLRAAGRQGEVPGLAWSFNALCPLAHARGPPDRPVACRPQRPTSRPRGLWAARRRSSGPQAGSDWDQYPERRNVSLNCCCSALSGVGARLPDLRVAMTVQDPDDCHFRLADHVENAVRKLPQQCPADFPVNPGIGQRVSQDPAQARVESLPELRSQTFSLTFVPSVDVPDVGFGWRGKA